MIMKLNEMTERLPGWKDRLIREINETCKREGSTPTDLARSMGLSVSTMHSYYRLGRLPPVENFVRICERCSADPCVVLFGENTHPNRAK